MYCAAVHSHVWSFHLAVEAVTLKEQLRKAPVSQHTTFGNVLKFCRTHALQKDMQNEEMYVSLCHYVCVCCEYDIVPCDVYVDVDISQLQMLTIVLH